MIADGRECTFATTAVVCDSTIGGATHVNNGIVASIEVNLRSKFKFRTT